MTQKLKAFFNGVCFTRSTDRSYTHVIIVRNKGQEWEAVRWAGCLELAQKALTQFKRYDEIRIIPVNNTEKNNTEKRDIGYVSVRRDDVESRQGFKPSVKACTDKKCPDLKKEEYNGVIRKICGVNDRIPGNLWKCPREVIE